MKKSIIFGIFMLFSTVIVAQTNSYQLSSHILDVSKGTPARGVTIKLEKLDEKTNNWIKVDEKVTDKKVKIILKDPSGKVLHQEYVAKNTPSYYGKFDMSQLEDGVYTFEITDGTEKIVKTVNLQSPETQETTRNLTVNK